MSAVDFSGKNLLTEGLKSGKEATADVTADGLKKDSVKVLG
jgi:hypothetical protein